jgi:hypothetical protein
VANPDQHESKVTVPDGQGLHIIRNVTVPTLTVFPANSPSATKTAVIIAPGGGFRVLWTDPLKDSFRHVVYRREYLSDNAIRHPRSHYGRKITSIVPCPLFVRLAQHSFKVQP